MMVRSRSFERVVAETGRLLKLLESAHAEIAGTFDRGEELYLSRRSRIIMES